MIDHRMAEMSVGGEGINWRITEFSERYLKRVGNNATSHVRVN